MSYYACKLCIWDQKLYGERFREAESWFTTPDELLSHLNRAHHSVRLTKELPCWPGVVADALGLAEGYLICYCSLEPKFGFSFTCYRCHATTTNLDDLRNLYCLSCGRRYTNYRLALGLEEPWQTNGNQL